MIESGFISWMCQKVANGFYTLAMPLLWASREMDEQAFQAAKRHGRRRR